MKKVILAWALLFACNTMWALQFTSVKLIQDQVGPYFAVFGPMLCATLLLIPFVYKDFGKGGKIRSWRDVLVFLQLALLGAFPAQVFMTWGAQYSLASNAAIISLSLPVITVIFAFIILKEKMSAIRWISFIIAIIGVILCSMGDVKQVDLNSKYAIGNILIFISIVGSAYYNVICKKIGERYTEAQLLFYSNIALLVLIFPMVIIFEGDVFQRIPQFTTQTWTGMSMLAFFHNFLSMILFFKALKMLEATQVALSNYLITFMGLPIAAIWLGEELNNGAIIGGVLVLISTLIITVVDYRVSRRQALERPVQVKWVPEPRS
jgi:drug/metabolite transporter (DMT)-like permease